jgi:hypothetical protein
MFKFNFGNKKPSIFKYAIVGVILTSIIGGLSQCTGVDERRYWDLFDEVQRKYVPGSMINDFIIKDPEKLERRIRRDVDKAIRQVTPEYDRIIERETQKYLPKYFEERNNEDTCYTKECKSLAPPMRICASWYEGCPLTNQEDPGILRELKREPINSSTTN